MAKLFKNKIFIAGIAVFLLVIGGVALLFLKGDTLLPKTYETKVYAASQEFQSTDDMLKTNPTGSGLENSYYTVDKEKYFFDADNCAYVDEGTFATSRLNAGEIPVFGNLKDLKADGTYMSGCYKYGNEIYYWDSLKSKWASVSPIKNSTGKQLSLKNYSNNVKSEIYPVDPVEDTSSSTDDTSLDSILDNGTTAQVTTAPIDNSGILNSDSSAVAEGDQSALYSYINGGSGNTGSYTRNNGSTNSYSNTTGSNNNPVGMTGATGATGKTGATGAQGYPGKDGAQGKSAFALAQSAGYKGSEADWLKSLSGQSAYQLAVKNGYNGTEADWIKSLKADSLYTTAVKGGFKGTEADFVKTAQGKSAYDVAVAGGYKGSEAEWVKSLAGKSAYQAAVDSGFKGTLEQWIASLKGATTYEIAVKSGFNGTEADFIKSLKGMSAYELAKANGYVGTEADWLKSLKSVQTDITVNNKTQDVGTKNITITAADILSPDQLKVVNAFPGITIDLTGYKEGYVLVLKGTKIVAVPPSDLGLTLSGTTPELGSAILSKTNPGEGYVCVNNLIVTNDTLPVCGYVLQSGPNAAILKASKWFADSTLTATNGTVIPVYKFMYNVTPTDEQKFYVYVGTVATAGNTKIGADGTLS